MKLELQQELFRRYPKFFRKPGKRLVAGPAAVFVDPTGSQGRYIDLEGRQKTAVGFHEYLADDTAPFDEWGVECDDGWFAVIDRLSRACETEIEFLVAERVPKECWPRVAQIKQKLGGLRFYVKGALSDALRVQIVDAENFESSRTCERCGEPRDPREGTTYCRRCEEESTAGTDPSGMSWENYKRHRAALRTILDSRSG